MLWYGMGYAEHLLRILLYLCIEMVDNRQLNPRKLPTELELWKYE